MADNISPLINPWQSFSDGKNTWFCFFILSWNTVGLCCSAAVFIFSINWRFFTNFNRRLQLNFLCSFQSEGHLGGSYRMVLLHSVTCTLLCVCNCPTGSLMVPRYLFLKFIYKRNIKKKCIRYFKNQIKSSVLTYLLLLVAEKE